MNKLIAMLIKKSIVLSNWLLLRVEIEIIKQWKRVCLLVGTFANLQKISVFSKRRYQ